MDYVIHENLWWWGKSYHFVTTDGKAMVCLAVEDDRPDCGCIQSLMVHESIREQGKGMPISCPAIIEEPDWSKIYVKL